MAGMSVAERLLNLKLRIEAECLRARRQPDSVRLLAVSKLQSLEAIREAYTAGQIDFAENYLQEALQKQDQLHDLGALRWHFIGGIQSNKVKQLAGRFAAIHSIDRLSIADALNRACLALGCVQDIFLQINIAGEVTKGGVLTTDFEDLLTAASKCANLRIRGLMVMPPLADDPEKTRPYFAKAREILSETRALVDERHPYNALSMGTSADFSGAIAEGATWVRIGTEIFGAREEKK